MPNYRVTQRVFVTAGGLVYERGDTVDVPEAIAEYYRMEAVPETSDGGEPVRERAQPEKATLKADGSVLDTGDGSVEVESAAGKARGSKGKGKGKK